MTDEPKELADYLQTVVESARKWAHHSNPGEPFDNTDECEAIAFLRDCIPVPRAEYERLRRALWRWGSFYYPSEVLRVYENEEEVDVLIAVEWLEQSNGIEYTWTHAAHKFAKEMEEEK